MKLFVSVSVMSALFLLSGCQEQCCDKLTPIAKIKGVPTQIGCGISFNADGTKSIAHDGEIVSYFWTLDDMQIDADTAKTTTTLLPCDDANHTLCLMVQDDKGAKSTTCQNISVINN